MRSQSIYSLIIFLITLCVPLSVHAFDETDLLDIEELDLSELTCEELKENAVDECMEGVTPGTEEEIECILIERE